MKGDAVPIPHHIARYCGGSHVKEDGSISGTAFRLRERSGEPEEYVSVNWLEFLKKEDRSQEIVELRDILRRKLRNVGSQAKIAVLKVGTVTNTVWENTEDRRGLRVVHQPEEEDPSHSGIRGLRLEDDLIADLIALAVMEQHPAK